ncbi:MAG: hypothetical protein IH984_16845 [Planctomycetes bacterium]|nr:hypothetical protein [Planctomycetota bacterium]
MAETRTIVLVGHCGPDMFMLKSAIGRAAADSPIVTVNDSGSLEEYLNNESVLLVNRELDGSFNTQSGIELIAHITKEDNPPIAMLISNYEEAQAQAVAAGARQGFGKSELYDESTTEALREAVGSA